MPLNTTVMDQSHGVTTTVNTEDGDGTYHINKVQDIQPTLDYVKQHHDVPIDRSAPYRKVAEIPPVLASKLYRQGILQDKKRLMKWLDRPENKPFRTWEGNLT